MKKIIKLLFSVLIIAALFSACVKEKPVKYNLTLVQNSASDIYEHFANRQSDTDKYEYYTADELSKYLSTDNIEKINSVTVFDTDITDETATEIINICASKDVPVFFIMSNISSETISSYDKAFLISTNNTYHGELLANEIKNLWKNGIDDRNGDQIFQYVVLRDEGTLQSELNFGVSLIKNIELLGVPMEELDDVKTQSDEILSVMNAEDQSECFVVLSSQLLTNLKDQYSPKGDGIEILGITYGFENQYADSPFMKISFINYNDMFRARDAILQNINNKVYPFTDFAYNHIDKIVYIEPSI